MRRKPAVLFVACVLELSAIGFTQSAPPASPQASPPRAPAAEPIQREIQLVALFDRNGDKRLDPGERQSAREYLAAAADLARELNLRGEVTLNQVLGFPDVIRLEEAREDAEIIWVDLGTMAIEIERTENNALLTKDPQYADIMPIAVISLVLAFLATIYPSWRASRVNPAEALRYE